MGKATWITGAALLTCTGMIGFALTGQAGAATARDGGAAPATTAPAAPAVTAPAASAPAKRPAVTAPAVTAPPKSPPAVTAPPKTRPAVSPPAVSPPAKGGKVPEVLRGKLQVAIVRVESFESAVSLLDNGRLGEVDGDEGRTLFVPTPLGRDKYLIKAFPETGGGEPDCWGVHNPRTTAPLTVHAVACDAADRKQHFTIIQRGKVFVISNRDAYLQHSPTRGLILEELGDAPLRSTFRLVANGAAPTYGD